MTKVQQMTDAELSRWIADKLEPEQKWEYGQFSPLQCWKLMERFTGHTYDHQWTPRDFINDPAMSMMLLQLPGFVSMCFIDEDNAYDVTFCGAKVHNLDCGAKMVTLIRPKLGRAIAECYALSLGDEPK